MITTLLCLNKIMITRTHLKYCHLYTKNQLSHILYAILDWQDILFSDFLVG